jgi:hypothetical protein
MAPPAGCSAAVEGGSFTSLSAGVQEGCLGAGPPCPGQKCPEVVSAEAPHDCATKTGVQHSQWRTGRVGGSPSPVGDRRPPGRTTLPPTQEFWAQPRRSSLTFLLVSGTMPFKGPSGAIFAWNPVEIPLVGLGGPQSLEPGGVLATPSSTSGASWGHIR